MGCAVPFRRDTRTRPDGVERASVAHVRLERRPSCRPANPHAVCALDLAQEIVADRTAGDDLPRCFSGGMEKGDADELHRRGAADDIAHSAEPRRMERRGPRLGEGTVRCGMDGAGRAKCQCTRVGAVGETASKWRRECRFKPRIDFRSWNRNPLRDPLLKHFDNRASGGFRQIAGAERNWKIEPTGHPR